MSKHQNHLNYENRINLGSYYTSTKYTYIDNTWTILDSSCGYGNFLQNVEYKTIGNDIDDIAIKNAKAYTNNVLLFNINALEDVNRSKYTINENEKLCIVGNPPYNDKASIIRQNIKQINFNIDDDLQSRDLGISFLKSYDKLKADVVCVLHPLSYLIKKSNFNLLKNFSKNYKLIKAKIISSENFQGSSKSTHFPIVIGLYIRNKQGMDYEYIREFDFEVNNTLSMKLNSFDYISNYIRKYPVKNAKVDSNSIFFWTMRDINALKRNKTFIDKNNKSAIVVDIDKLDYYIYVDVFKRYSKYIPYYLGNCDVIINNDLFLIFKNYFILDGLFYNPKLKKHYSSMQDNFDRIFVENKLIKYFELLLGADFICDNV